MTGSAKPSAAEIDAARLVLSRMGVTADDLVSEPAHRPEMPTFAEYVAAVAKTVTYGTGLTYSSYWRRIVAEWGERRLDEPTASEIRQFADRVKANAVPRRNGRGGRTAAEAFIAAVRCIYRRAEDDKLIKYEDNPARRVAKPRRQPSTRHAIQDTRLAEINHVAATTGNDPALDTLVLRLHTETACRRGGALSLRPMDLDEEQCPIRLREKGDTVRWQPVSPTLMAHLVAHAQERGAAHDGQLLRYTYGKSITKRRYEHLWERPPQVPPVPMSRPALPTSRPRCRR